MSIHIYQLHYGILCLRFHLIDYLYISCVVYTVSPNRLCIFYVLKCSIVRLEIGEPQLKNNQNKDFQPIFYKGTTFANYEEAMHVLLFNNYALMDDLFGNRSTKANCDALVAKKLDDEICVNSNDNELYNKSQVENELYEESQGDNDEDQLYFESGCTNDILSPNQYPNDLSRFQNNIIAYVSPSTKRLHDDIIRNSPSRVRHHNADSLRASRKNMISIIDYIISIGEIEDDPQSAMLFDNMEKTLQKFKLELQQRKLSQPKTPPRKDMIEFPAFNGPKKKPEPRLKGFGG
jgi:hypothetical protein